MYRITLLAAIVCADLGTAKADLVINSSSDEAYASASLSSTVYDEKDQPAGNNVFSGSESGSGPSGSTSSTIQYTTIGMFAGESLSLSGNATTTASVTTTPYSFNSADTFAKTVIDFTPDKTMFLTTSLSGAGNAPGYVNVEDLTTSNYLLVEGYPQYVAGSSPLELASGDEYLLSIGLTGSLPLGASQSLNSGMIAGSFNYQVDIESAPEPTIPSLLLASCGFLFLLRHQTVKRSK